jgi:hypothetical protein
LSKNSIFLVLLASILVFVFPASIYAETLPGSTTNVTINSLGSYTVGNMVTIAGTTTYSEVIVKTIAPDNTNLFYDIVPAKNGSYTTSFTIPDSATPGTYNVVVGKGTEVENTSFLVYASHNDHSGSSSGSSTGGSAGFNTGTPTNKVEFKSSDIPKPQNGLVTLNVTLSQNQNSVEILLPGSLAQQVGDNKVQLIWGNVTLIIPKEVLESLAALIPSDKLSGSVISLQINQLSTDQADKIASLTNSKVVTVRTAGAVLDLTLSVKQDDGKRTKLEQFVKPVVLKLKLNDQADKRLAGIYYISDNERMEYVGGKSEGNMMAAEVTHFSKYGVFAYDKSYSDVAANHWAYQVIKELSAKHIVDGVDATTFVPEKEVTRAEFVTMLVRHLKLNASKSVQLEDVKADSWYADSVAAAYSNGIVEGTSPTKFDPEKQITREEMCVMMTRVYTKVTGKTIEAATVSYKDSNQISDWAKSSVSVAAKEGIMVGRVPDEFAPKEQANRAEASQVLYNLINSTLAS